MKQSLTIGDILEAAVRMYPQLQYLYRTADSTIHTSPEGARAQARHLADGKIERYNCKTGKAKILK